MPRNYRISAFGTVVALIAIIGAVVVGLSLDHGLNSDTTPLITALLAIIGTTVPSILALIKTESVQNDIRNGVLKEKVKQGTTEALIEHQVVTRDGPAITVQIQALKSVIESNQALLHKLIEQDDKDNGRPSV